MGLLHFSYLSETLGYHTNLYFILPACTHKGKEPRATLYLLHGDGGNGLDWIRYTALEQLTDKYEIAVVLPEVDGSCFYADMEYGYNYFTYLTEEVVTVAESLFPVNKDVDKRFVAGFSMGGYGAFKWTLHYPDFFSAAANLSGFSLISDLFTNPNSIVKKGSLPKLFAGIGTEDVGYEHGHRFIDYCSKNGIDVHYEEMPGQHEWKVCEVMLGRFLDWVLNSDRQMD